MPESASSWQKSHEERILDVLAERHPACRVVRLRPALIFKRSAAREIRNLFIGPLAPIRLLPVDRRLPTGSARRPTLAVDTAGRSAQESSVAAMAPTD